MTSKQPKTLLEVFTGQVSDSTAGEYIRRLLDLLSNESGTHFERKWNEAPRRTVIELGRLPNPDLSPNKRLHHMVLYRAKAAAKMDAIALVMAQGKPDHPYERAHITITWIAKDRRTRDIDNLFASMKPFIDGLVHVGLLRDDDAMRVSYTLRYQQGEKANTIIEVEEIDG